MSIPVVRVFMGIVEEPFTLTDAIEKALASLPDHVASYDSVRFLHADDTYFVELECFGCGWKSLHVYMILESGCDCDDQ